jgi:hypothetical protein
MHPPPRNGCPDERKVHKHTVNGQRLSLVNRSIETDETSPSRPFRHILYYRTVTELWPSSQIADLQSREPHQKAA